MPPNRRITTEMSFAKPQFLYINPEVSYIFDRQTVCRSFEEFQALAIREGINPRELMPPFTILAARLFLSPPTSLCPQNEESRQR